MSEEIAVQTPTVAPENLIGQVLPEEGAWLRQAARAVPAGQVIVELGSYTGKSTCCLAVGSGEGNKVPVYAVDLWTTGTYEEETHRFYQYDPGSGETQRNSKFSRPPARELFEERCALYDPDGLIRPIIGLSTRIAAVFDQPIGLLFIDADHTYEAVKADFEAWAPKVLGVVAFHDYAGKPEHHGVKRFVAEAVLGHGWHEVAQVASLLGVMRDA